MEIESAQQSTKLHTHAIRVLMVAMGLLIVVFNVMGYEVLFSDSPFAIFPFVSPMGMLLLIAEAAVLVWTSGVIANWPNASKLLKFSMAFILPIFWFICYAGISSYLSSLATSEIDQVREFQQQAKNNKQLISTIAVQIEQTQDELLALRAQRNKENQKIAEFNQAIDTLSVKASERRQTAANCALVDDCRASVEAFENQMERMQLELGPIRKSRDRTDARIFLLEDKLDDLTQNINKIKRDETLKLNAVANTESNYEVKKDAYANTISDVLSVFGITLSDPFQVFINILAFVIYPLYFLLNLYTSLQSDANVRQRILRREETASYRKQKKDYRSLRYALGLRIKSYLRARALRKKKEMIDMMKKKLEIRRAKQSKRSKLYQKLVTYLRVWVHRRKKVIEVPIETIVEKVVEKEVVVEVEKIVEKEIEVEVEKIVEVEKVVEKEVPVEVDRIVKVLNEVPVYVDKLKTVPEKEIVFLNEPQIIIHERIIPVPENITGLELEELLNAQPRLNTNARSSEEEASHTSESEGDETETSSGERTTSKPARENSSREGAAA